MDDVAGEEEHIFGGLIDSLVDVEFHGGATAVDQQQEATIAISHET